MRCLTLSMLLGALLGMAGPVAPVDKASDQRQGMPLTVHDVGEYAAVPWQAPGAEIKPGSRAERVKDLTFAVSSVNLNHEDSASAQFRKHWADVARWGRQQGKKLLPRIHFWDGKDRYAGPMQDIEVYWQRLDGFLGAMDLADFHGMVLSEENVHYSGRPEVLRELYRRVKTKYDIPVWQWWSPMTAVPGSGGWIPADGWVVDPYFMPREQFRRYLRKYLITGLPVVVMPWASDERETTPDQDRANNDQLDTAVEFGLPVAFYWVSKSTCYFNGRRDAHETAMDRINQGVWRYIERVGALPTEYAGLPSADIASGAVLEIGPTEPDRFIYTDDFSTSKCVDQASMSGFRDLVLDGRQLLARGFMGRRPDATLTYQFSGEFIARSPQVSVTAFIPEGTEGRVEMSLSRDGKTWPHRVATQGSGAQQLVLSSAEDEAFASLESFNVRVRLSGDPGGVQAPACSIDDLRVDAGIKAPAERVARLGPEPDAPGRLAYEDTFMTRKYLLTAAVEGAEHLEWSPGSIAVRLRPGGSKPVLTWHVIADRPLRDIVVKLSGRANRGSLGTNHYLEASRDGEVWPHRTTTEGRAVDVNGWVREALTLDLSGEEAFAGVEDFYVRLRMVAGSHREMHRAQSGVVTGLRIDAQPAG